MTWNFYEDDLGEDKPVVKKVIPQKQQDFSGLILLGLGLLGGYLLFSEEEKKEEPAKPLDPLDKAVANKIEIHGNPNIIVGGKGDFLTPKDVDSKEYAKGLKIEMEHTNDKDIASEIALDHLAEDDKYYTHLESIHKENPNTWKEEGYKIYARDFVIDDYDTGTKRKIPEPYAYAFLGDKQVGWANTILKNGKYSISGVWIDVGHRRKGLANAMYVALEEILGTPLEPSDVQYEDGVKLWSQTNRPFGNKKENPIKDPKGGLTAQGRKHFKETEGANLKPGVTKVETLEDLKRWGQWARRFFGRSILPPLRNEKGEPTRLALDAQAWGCKIPKTKKEAKVIAKRGTEALRYYKELKKKGLKKNDSVRFKICHD